MQNWSKASIYGSVKHDTPAKKGKPLDLLFIWWKNSLGLELLSLFNSSFVLDPEKILKQKKYKLYDSIIESSSPLPRKN